MKRPSSIAFMLALAGLSYCLSSCQREAEVIYIEDDPFVPTLSLEMKTALPEKLYLSDDLNFTVDIASRFVGLSTVIVDLISGEEKIGSMEFVSVEEKQQETFTGKISIPFVPNIPDGTATLKFTVKNVNGGKREFTYDIPIERPDYPELLLVLSDGSEISIPRTEKYQYHLEGDFAQDPDAYIKAPAMDANGKELKFGLTETGAIAIDGTEGFPIAKMASGKSVVSFNTNLFTYHVSGQAYLYKVALSGETGLPPADSPFYDVIVSRNKKAVDSYGRTGNRITYPPGHPQADQNVRFAYKPGSQIIDGFTGNPRSTIIDSYNLQINIGSKKTINGKPCVFIFSTLTDKGQQSGWTYEENLNDPVLQQLCAPDLAIDLTPSEVGGDCPITYSVYAADTTGWGELKVRANQPRSANVAVTDYLDRGDGTTYLLYALPFFGGYANEAVIGKGEPKFIPDKDMPTVTLPIFLPRDPDNWDIQCYERLEKKEMEWVFGRIQEARGWITNMNLQNLE